MAGLTGTSERWRREAVSVQHLPATARDAQVSSLERPWVAEEGPMQVKFRRIEETEDLLPRGLAFDAQRTVTWDEDGVEVITPIEADESTVALQSPVLVRDRFSDLPALLRIDYLKDGVWLASRYLAKGEEDHA